MKTKIFIIAILFTINCKSQIKSLYDDEYGAIVGAYYKDTYNDFNQFEGTWISDNGNITLLIKLQKKVYQFIDDGYITFYQDILVGEYRYLENGIEKINTLPNLLIDYEDTYYYNLAGHIISKPVLGIPEACSNCGPNDTKVQLTFAEPNREIFGYSPRMVFHHFVENRIEKLKVVFSAGGNVMKNLNGEESQYSTYTIPFGVYILTRQQ